MHGAFTQRKPEKKIDPCEVTTAQVNNTFQSHEPLTFDPLFFLAPVWCVCVNSISGHVTASV